MQRNRRVGRLGLAFVGIVSIAATGCFPGFSVIGTNLEFFARGLGIIRDPAKAPTVRESIPVTLECTYGGLDGTFEVGVGSYGSVSGTAQIKGQKAAQLKLKSDAQTKSLVEAMVLDVTGVEVDVTKSKTVFKGSQTTGGVEKRYKCQISWKGTIVGGDDDGKTVGGKIKTSGSFE